VAGIHGGDGAVVEQWGYLYYFHANDGGRRREALFCNLDGSVV